MSSYTIKIRSKAQKELAALPAKDRVRVVAIIDALSADPRPDGCAKLSGKLYGFYRVRSGGYRVIYKIKDGELIVLVLKVGKRGDVYKIYD